jgi:predicted AAA+ superfamily ATPase
MYTRIATLPDHSFFLLGPRGSGKTTWLRRVLADARWYDLVHDAELWRLMRAPEVFRAEVLALPAGTWVVVDEVQRFPGLVNEVQALITERGQDIRYALTGSSARKLRRGEVNLLPGRAVQRSFHPLTARELGADFDLDRVLRFGGLPAVQATGGTEGRVDLLEAYVAGYLSQEIRAEAAVRSLDAFTRFLDVAALANAQVVNVASLARDAGVARPTVQGWFDVLTETMLGVWLPSWQPRVRVRETGHPKFFFFDTGVVRTLTGRVRDPITAEERGSLLETWLLHELRAYQEVARTGGRLSYWRTPQGVEVDFVWSRGDHHVAIEVKASARWRPEYLSGLNALLATGLLARAYCVYGGDVAMRFGEVEVLPVAEFLARLQAGGVLEPGGGG